MLSGDSKRVVVIRDIPSNIIEEAILILKPEPGLKNTASTPKPQGKTKKNRDDFLLKEAEVIINSYIREANTKTGQKKLLGNRDTAGRKRILPLNTVINIVLVGSIVFLIFMISRMF